MALPFKIKTFDDLPENIRDIEQIREQYKQVAGGYQLDTLNDERETKINEFRENNVKLLKRQTELEQKYSLLSDDRLEEIRRADEEAEKNENYRLAKTGIAGMDKVIEKTTEQMRKKHQDELKAAREEAGKYKTAADSIGEKWRKTKVQSAIREQAERQASVFPGAMRNIEQDALDVFYVNENDEVVPKENAPRDEEGRSFTTESFIPYLAKTNKHYFIGSGGGGANGGGRQSGGDARNGPAGSKVRRNGREVGVISIDDYKSGKYAAEYAKGEVIVQDE